LYYEIAQEARGDRRLRLETWPTRGESTDQAKIHSTCRRGQIKEGS
jgi:hypothetical protein